MTGAGYNKNSFHEAKSHYRELRRVAHDFTEEEYSCYTIKLREISYSDAVEADKWSDYWDDSQKIPSWDWVRMYHDYQSNSGVKRFDAALMMNGVLCAMCYGVPSAGKLTLKLHAISRKPNNNPLEGKVLTIMLFAADAYARILGCTELWICNPMNERLVDVYEKSGYTANRNRLGITTHLSLRLSYE